jgi:ERCC4-type nuclease
MFSQITNLASRSTIFSAITSLNHFKGFSVFRTASVQETAEYVYYTAIKLQREFEKHRVPWYQEPEPEPEPVYEKGEYTTDTSYCVTSASYTIYQTDLPMMSMSSVNNSQSDDPVQAVQVPLPTIPAYCTVVKKVKKDNVTPANIGEIVLCQIPSISSVSAIAIMKKFGTLAHLIDEVSKNPACMDDIQTTSSAGTRKISRAVLQNIRKFLIDQTP